MERLSTLSEVLVVSAALYQICHFSERENASLGRIICSATWGEYCFSQMTRDITNSSVGREAVSRSQSNERSLPLSLFQTKQVTDLSSPQFSLWLLFSVPVRCGLSGEGRAGSKGRDLPLPSFSMSVETLGARPKVLWLPCKTPNILSLFSNPLLSG
jgi:hypothetical protein